MKKHAPNDNKLAIAYYRYSSASQNEASIEQQQRSGRSLRDSPSSRSTRTWPRPVGTWNGQACRRCWPRCRRSDPPTW